ncbi:MAG: HDOD domain-containing protein [Desulfuromonadaceae bacterium]|nr:HDOD domain-containing protein [Desulfuromonadaceae bacterium]
MSPINKLFSDGIKLPSPPAIAIKIIETVRRDDFSFKDLAAVLETDPALTVRILRAANSPYYNVSSTVNSIEKSLAILGTHAVKNIALSFVICSGFTCDAYETFDSAAFWRHALSSAVAAELTARLAGVSTDDIFISALLHDIGIMIMHGWCPQDYRRVVEHRNEGNQSLTEIERDIFGFDHQEVGARLLENWLLPKDIYEPIRYHHLEVVVQDEYKVPTTILCIANNLSSFYNGSQDVNKIRQVKRLLDTDFCINGKKVDALVESVAVKSLELFSSFEIAPGEMRPFSQILQEANRGLSELHDSYELQIIELKQSKAKLQKQAKELMEINEKLRELASYDGLTGICNYRVFQETMDSEIARSRRYGREFALIMFDVDNLKRINDEYGHPVGDTVLVSICQAVKKIIRESDTFVRSGGDEFAVIMPETDKKRAAIVAEHLRTCVEELPIHIENKKIPVRISIGLTTFDPSNDTTDKGQIILMADKALYEAKRSGRNVSKSFFIHT